MCTRRHESRIEPPSVHTPHCVRALESATRGAGWPSSAAKCAARGVSASSAAALSHFTRAARRSGCAAAAAFALHRARAHARSSTISPNSGRRSPLAPRRRTGLRRHRPFVELGEDPALLLAHEAFDVAPRRAQRRRDLQAVGVDGDAERAPPPAHEAVFHFAASRCGKRGSGKRFLLLFDPCPGELVDGLAGRGWRRRSAARCAPSPCRTA